MQPIVASLENITSNPLFAEMPKLPRPHLRRRAGGDFIARTWWGQMSHPREKARRSWPLFLSSRPILTSKPACRFKSLQKFLLGKSTASAPPGTSTTRTSALLDRHARFGLELAQAGAASMTGHTATARRSPRQTAARRRRARYLQNCLRVVGTSLQSFSASLAAIHFPIGGRPCRHEPKSRNAPGAPEAKTIPARN